MVAGVLAEAVSTDSQFPPEVVVGVAVKATGVSGPFTDMVFFPGVLLPCVEANNKLEGVTVGGAVAAGLTFRLTVTCWLLATPGPLIVTGHV
jgi:hypothetical protein